MIELLPGFGFLGLPLPRLGFTSNRGKSLMTEIFQKQIYV